MIAKYLLGPWCLCYFEVTGPSSLDPIVYLGNFRQAQFPPWAPLFIHYWRTRLKKTPMDVGRDQARNSRDTGVSLYLSGSSSSPFASRCIPELPSGSSPFVCRINTRQASRGSDQRKPMPTPTCKYWLPCRCACGKQRLPSPPPAPLFIRRNRRDKDLFMQEQTLKVLDFQRKNNDHLNRLPSPTC